MSSTEAEYVAASDTAHELIWCRNLLRELGYDQEGPSELLIDNSGAAEWASGPSTGYFRKTKHLELRHHYVREQVAHKKLSILRVPTNAQPADCMTKVLSGPLLTVQCDRLQLLPPNSGKSILNTDKKLANEHLFNEIANIRNQSNMDTKASVAACFLVKAKLLCKNCGKTGHKSCCNVCKQIEYKACKLCDELHDSKMSRKTACLHCKNMTHVYKENRNQTMSSAENQENGSTSNAIDLTTDDLQSDLRVEAGAWDVQNIGNNYVAEMSDSHYEIMFRTNLPNEPAHDEGNGSTFYVTALVIIRMFTDFGSAIMHAYTVPRLEKPVLSYTYLGDLGIYCSGPNLFAALDDGYSPTTMLPVRRTSNRTQYIAGHGAYRNRECQTRGIDVNFLTPTPTFSNTPIYVPALASMTVSTNLHSRLRNNRGLRLSIVTLNGMQTISEERTSPTDHLGNGVSSHQN